MHLQQQRRPEPIRENDESANIQGEIFDDELDEEIKVLERMNREELGCQPDQDVIQE